MPLPTGLVRGPGRTEPPRCTDSSRQQGTRNQEAAASCSQAGCRRSGRPKDAAMPGSKLVIFQTVFIQSSTSALNHLSLQPGTGDQRAISP